MKKYLIFFLVICIYGSCTSTKSDNVEVKAREKSSSSIGVNRLETDFSDWLVLDDGHHNIIDFDITKEYYYQILFNEWLKKVDLQDLKPIRSIKEAAKILMRDSEQGDSVNVILKKHYNIELKSYDVSSMGHENYPFSIVCINEQMWILISRTSRRAVWYKDNMEKPAWREVRENLSELRDNNTYTFFLRNVEFGIKYQCPIPQELIKIDGLPDGPVADIIRRQLTDVQYQCPIPRKSGIFPNCVDSVTAICLAMAAIAECYGYRGNEITPLAAKRMGDNQEPWLVYAFTTIPDAEEQKKAYRIFTRIYKEGLSLWDMNGYPCYDNLRLTPENVRCSSWGVRTFATLISRETGEVLFMN
jgi:hypothetical protein